MLVCECIVTSSELRVLEEGKKKEKKQRKKSEADIRGDDVSST